MANGGEIVVSQLWMRCKLGCRDTKKPICSLFAKNESKVENSCFSLCLQQQSTPLEHTNWGPSFFKLGLSGFLNRRHHHPQQLRTGFFPPPPPWSRPGSVSSSIYSKKTSVAARGHPWEPVRPSKPAFPLVPAPAKPTETTLQQTNITFHAGLFGAVVIR